MSSTIGNTLQFMAQSDPSTSIAFCGSRNIVKGGVRKEILPYSQAQELVKKNHAACML